MMDFDILYQSLNSAQKLAVDTIEGPVMVIAGPGTGKTQILAVRILNILRTTDAKPEDILCLTYTESGSAAMRKRLGEFMGADASKINIYTFHGLCNKIILENPEIFSLRGGDSERQRVMDDLEKMDLMDGLIRSIDPQSPIKNYAEDPIGLRWQLGKLFDLMQEENYTVAQLGSMVSQISSEEDFKEAFPDLVYKKTTKFGEAGSLKRSAYEEFIKDWNKLLSAAELFEEYQQRKKQLGVYEFRDMIHWVLDALKNNPELLAVYQEKFQYLMVDEFQDTSGVQNEIVQLLIAYWDENPNCFVVGDDDQSIYAFQGARVSNMLHFAQKYASTLRTIVLTENYRSTQNILDAAGKVIENNQLRLIHQMPDLNKNLNAAGKNAMYPTTAVQVFNYRNRFHEAVGTTRYVEQLHEQGSDWNEIAIIYSKHAIVEEFVQLLREKEIPFHISRSINILEEPLIQKLCNWLEYLSLELELPHKGEFLLYEMLHYDLYAIEPYEVAKISAEIHAQKGLHWRDFLSNYVSKPRQADLFQNDGRSALKTLWTQVEIWIKRAASLTVPELVHQVIAEGGFLSTALAHPEREWHLELLHTFLNFVNNYNIRKPFLSLQDLMEDISKMRRNGLSIALERRIGNKDGIVLTSAHGSKGLEYDHVCIIGAEHANWENDRANTLPFKLTKLFEGLQIKESKQQLSDENAEERRRLFYVALTRAKKDVAISYTNQKIDAKGSELQPSRFLLEITGGTAYDEIGLNTEDLINTEIKLLRKFNPPQLAVKESSWLQKQIENFKFTPSTLYDILDCGLRFYFNRIVRLPSPPNAAMGYGSAMHVALKTLIDTYTGKPNWPGPEFLVESFENAMFGLRSNFTKQSFDTRMEQGRDLLPEYYAQRLAEFQSYKLVQTERWMECSIHGIIIGGIIDKIIFNGNHVTVIDYKTGNPKNAEKKLKAPSAKSLESGVIPPNYWFQLGIYQILVNNQAGKSWEAKECCIDSLQKDDDGQFPLLRQYYTSEDLQLLYGYIEQGQQKLESLDFLKGCGKPDCEWCQLAKETGQIIQIPENTIEDIL